ncbi:MAG: hypothetical protein A7316_05990 [Candidatus Altiarchaeales archaeon WOR_SM1_86-2]|nr:MAG: hypothetical protein A7316_05990 [Candidatus Altiarchaeales archaeon WOR_SM1_86-2]ODS41759.1 MAG: hypothetical protein A7315_00360 [Candidatus Altiarchaeales archaeon WOR_SM1_79]
MNFIFGIASYGRGAVVSIFRLDSLKLIENECIHEVGHVLGLGHCMDYCVMRFSNSLYEAKQKPGYLCEKCKRKLK